MACRRAGAAERYSGILYPLKYKTTIRGDHMKLRAIWRIAGAVSVGAALCGGSFSAAAGEADNYPSRPVRFITPAAPGGTTDQLARLFSQRMSEIWKQQVIVDNRASASGVIAGELTMQAAPDGYTLFLPYHQHTINAALLSKLPYHPV